jgi:hypothetical protein
MAPAGIELADNPHAQMTGASQVDARFLELGDTPPSPPARPLDYFDLCRIAPPPALLRRFPLAFCDRWRWIPLHETDSTDVRWLPAHAGTPKSWPGGSERLLVIAMERPDDVPSLQAIAMRAGRSLQAVSVQADALDRFLAERYPIPVR